jgi:inner membrane protein involved in colicin E2 resistance
MSELIAKVSEILGIPETLVQRSAEARAEASGNTVEEILQSWAGGEAVASSAPVEEAPVVEETPVEEIAEVSDKEVETEERSVEKLLEKNMLGRLAKSMELNEDNKQKLFDYFESGELEQ